MSGLADQFDRALSARLDADDNTAAPEWLVGLRRRGLERFRSAGFPTRRVERWKYTSLDLLEQREPELGEARAAPSASASDPVLDGVPRIVLTDGVFHDAPKGLPEGLSVAPLAVALQSPDPDLQALLSELELEGDAAALAALNTAALGPGIVIRVGREVDAGVLLLQWALSGEAPGRLINSRVCILVEPGARLEVLEQFDSPGGADSQINAVVQIGLQNDACLRHARLQQLGEGALLVTHTDIGQASGSAYHYAGLDLGGRVVRHDVRARLTGQGATCSLSGAAITRGQAHVDNHLDAEHLAPACSSRQWFRAVLENRSRVVFNGRVHVAPGADGTDAQQSSAGLLLSPLAEIDSKPELEIYADEVVASHGATVGQLDEEQLFYLQTRGLSREAAKAMLTEAFCRALVDGWPAGPVRDILSQRAQARLAAGGESDG